MSSATVLLLLLTASLAQPEVPGYRFGWVKTYLGPCCSDGGADLTIDSEGDVFVTGHRGGLDLDRDGSVDIQTHGSPDTLLFKSTEEGGEIRTLHPEAAGELPEEPLPFPGRKLLFREGKLQDFNIPRSPCRVEFSQVHRDVPAVGFSFQCEISHGPLSEGQGRPFDIDLS